MDYFITGPVTENYRKKSAKTTLKTDQEYDNIFTGFE